MECHKCFPRHSERRGKMAFYFLTEDPLSTLVLSKDLEDHGREGFKGIPLGQKWRMLLYERNAKMKEKKRK